MVAQPARGAHDDMRAPLQRPAFGAIVHAADAGRQLHARGGVKPLELARHLLGQFPRGRHHQRQRLFGRKQGIHAPQHLGRDGKAKGHRLARSGLRGNQQVAPRQPFGQHGLLHRGQPVIALVLERRLKRARHAEIIHYLS